MVIINADDFGLNESCSKAISLAFERSLVTDTSIMTGGSYFDEAIRLAEKQGFSDKIGIHLNLTEGKPLTDDIKKLPDFVTDGSFNKKYDQNKPLSPDEGEAVYRELSAQVARVEMAGIKLTRSHHYIHNAPFIAPIAERVCGEHGIKRLRLMRNWGEMPEAERQKADSYRQALRARGFETTRFFGRLSEAADKPLPASIELLVHPDFDKDGNLIDRRGTVDGFAVGSEILSLKI